jgi:TonB family protein
MLRVTSDGSVHSAHLLTPSGYTDWDSLALEVVRQWRFSPARMGTRPVPCWIQQKVRVRFEPPEPITLAELVCPDRLLVDSLHALIVEGASFDSLARIYSVAASRDKGGFLGEIDARSFPAHVRQRLTALRVDDITSPLIVGRNVAIFKRLRRIP